MVIEYSDTMLTSTGDEGSSNQFLPKLDYHCEILCYKVVTTSLVVLSNESGYAPGWSF